MAKKILSWEKKRSRYGYFFILPFIVGSICYFLLPMLNSLIYSLSSLSVTTDGFALDFIGFENYRRLLLVDPSYRKTLLSSLNNMLINVPVTIIFSFFIASVLNQKFKGRGLFRGIFFLPVIMSSGIYQMLSNIDPLANSSAAQYGSATDGGGMSAALVNTLESMEVGAGIIGFLVGTVERISDIVGISAIPIVIFLAGFQSISPSIFEASYIEGATKWEVFWKISFPMVSPLILATVVYTISDSFTNSANIMISLVHNTSFDSFQFALGSAMIWIYLVVILAIVAVVYAIVNRFVFYFD